MPSNNPKGFVPISSLSSYVNQEVNVIGVVTDFLPAARSKGTDWTCNFRLADERTYDDGVKFRYFKPMEIELPQLEGIGDVVILQKVKITQWSGMVVGISSKNTLWTVCPATSIPESMPKGRINLKCIRGKGSSAPTEEQMRSAIELCNSRDRTCSSTSPTTIDPSSTAQTLTPVATPLTAGVSSSITARREKFALVKDVQPEMYYDLVGQVVKTYPGNGVLELYFTDYTSNSLLFNYGWGHGDDETSTLPKWRGPLGKHTLTVSLFPPHSYYAQSNVEEDQYIFLRNTRIKYSKSSKLEGSLHTDRRNPDRVDITIIKDRNNDRVKDLLRRKLEYTKQFSRQKDAFISMNEGQKRKQTEEHKLSKHQAKRKRKREREEEAQKKKQQVTASNDEVVDKDNSDPFRIHITPKMNSTNRQPDNNSTPATSPPPETPPSKATSLNENIRASNLDIPTRSLTSILSYEDFTSPEGLTGVLPFRNVKSRGTFRVVGFYPRSLADFAVKKRTASEFDVLSDYEGDSDSSSDDDAVELPPDTDEEDNAGNDDQSTRSEIDDGSDEESTKWEWRFLLLLEDASAPSKPKEPNERLILYVGGADAEFLLKLDACDLRRKTLRLNALREKLFLLWGDLEEKLIAEKKGKDGESARGARSRPFVCCIKEYGVRSSRKHRNYDASVGKRQLDENHGWERRFRMFGTTIL
ncbi:MAG: hypothetical protein LQ337_004387 [Flavoplaca oasis]|nr:MAG: hypothetical protein LQ337_004387 [Flavoplaca oasis]